MPVELDLKNIAQIRSGSFALSSFTVFIGPNNSGKSIAAICAYAACQSARPGSSLMASSPDPPPLDDQPDNLSFPRLDATEDAERTSDVLMDLMKKLVEGVEVDDLSIPRFLTEFTRARTGEILSLYGWRLGSELERCFGTRLEEVARRQNDSKSEIVVRTGSWSVKLQLRSGPDRVRVSRLPSVRSLVIEALKRLDTSVYQASRFSDGFFKGRILGEFMGSVHSQIFNPHFPRSAQYLPAERSGILQSHRLLASAVLRRASYVGIERLEMPQMSGVISDFLSNILEIDKPEETDAKKHFGRSASYLEKDVLHGSIAIDRQDHGYPEIAFRQGKAAFPLHRVSSMITEIAPIVLYLRHLLHRNDLFIVEEPESHLHPLNQVRIADELVRLRSEQLNLLVTTHSDYFLNELSNAIRESALESRDASDDQRGIDPSAITAYGFIASSGGTRIRKLSISPVDGIDEEEFGRVTEQLYKRTVELEERIGAQ
jgi:predicted ATPase